MKRISLAFIGVILATMVHAEPKTPGDHLTAGDIIRKWDTDIMRSYVQGFVQGVITRDATSENPCSWGDAPDDTANVASQLVGFLKKAEENSNRSVKDIRADVALLSALRTQYCTENTGSGE